MENDGRRLSRDTKAVWECIPAGKTGIHVQRQQSRPTSMDDLTDDLLELVLLRVPSPICLIRAAATRRLWRRVIADTGFLRRFRSLHGPHVLGHYEYYFADGTTVFVPSPAAAVDDDTIQNREIVLSLDFLSDQSDDLIPMVLKDCRGGLLAFLSSNTIIVWDPLTKEHRELSISGAWEECLGVFLLDADETDTGAPISNFRVLYVHLVEILSDNSSTTARALVFSAASSRGWHKLSCTTVGDIIPGVVRYKQFEFIGRAGGSLYWSVEGKNILLLVSESTGEFSSVTMPGMTNSTLTHHSRRDLRVIDSRDNTEASRLVLITGSGDLQVLAMARGDRECVVERKISLCQLPGMDVSPKWSWHFLESAVATPGCVVLSPGDKCTFIFSVDIKTLEAERVLQSNSNYCRVFPYELPWPPTFNAYP